MRGPMRACLHWLGRCAGLALAVPLAAPAQPAPAGPSMATATAPAATVASSRVLDRAMVTARHADAQSRFIEVDGVRVHYKDQGRGPAILLVHGTLGDLGDWDGWAAALSARHRVLRLDLPGFGLTGPVRSGNYSVDRHLSLVDGLMDELGIEHFAIAGISYGGLVAFRYAATRTDRVTALILTNSAGIEAGRPGAAAPTASAASAPGTAASAAAAPRRNIFYDPVVTADDVRSNLLHMVSDAAVITPQMVQRKLDYLNILGRGEESAAGRNSYERGNPQRVLAHVRAPALVLWGSGNRALETATADAFAAAMKNACSVQRVLVPDGGHLLIVDQAARSAAAALEFLDRAAAQRGCRSPALAQP